MLVCGTASDKEVAEWTRTGRFRHPFLPSDLTGAGDYPRDAQGTAEGQVGGRSAADASGLRGLAAGGAGAGSAGIADMSDVELFKRLRKPKD